MKKTYTIEVTETDIKFGNPSDCKRCPIALAMCRTFGPNTKARIGYQIALIGTEGKAAWKYRGTMPNVAAQFISDFDRRSYMCIPFTFEIQMEEII
jgi:hypothetical protein